jgi:hypothetical protein
VTTTELAEYLKVMRDAGCMSAELTMPANPFRYEHATYYPQAPITIRAVFAPPEPTPFGETLSAEPKPGGWKDGSQ